MATKQDYLKETIEHIDIKKHNVVPIVDDMKNMAFSARDLATAAEYYDMMLSDEMLRDIVPGGIADLRGAEERHRGHGEE